MMTEHGMAGEKRFPLFDFGWVYSGHRTAGWLECLVGCPEMMLRHECFGIPFSSLFYPVFLSLLLVCSPLRA